ncbi:MAG: hypothetical protein WCY81_02655 [Sphaerochaetaceae bacterium]
MKTDEVRRYRRAITQCSLKLSLVDEANAKESALWIYRMGVAFSKIGELGEAVRCFSNAFLLRNKEQLDTEHLKWREFHDIQMAIYLLGKRNKVITSLAEGDMIHHLIMSRWYALLEQMKSAHIQLATDNLTEWFKSVKIDFPWELEDIGHINEANDL